MGGPVLLAIAFLVLLFLPVDPASAHGRAVPLLCLVIAGAFGCRVAYHLHMRRADDYGGAYTRPEVYRRTRLTYLGLCVVYAVVAVYLAHLAVEARGLTLPI